VSEDVRRFLAIRRGKKRPPPTTRREELARPQPSPFAPRVTIDLVTPPRTKAVRLLDEMDSLSIPPPPISPPTSFAAPKRARVPANFAAPTPTDRVRRRVPTHPPISALPLVKTRWWSDFGDGLQAKYGERFASDLRKTGLNADLKHAHWRTLKAALLDRSDRDTDIPERVLAGELSPGTLVEFAQNKPGELAPAAMRRTSAARREKMAAAEKTRSDLDL